MQWLAAVCIRRPVFTWVLMLSLVVVGAASIFGLGVDRYPNVEFPLIVVSTVLPGASPEQVETEVSDKLEESINSISGLEELRSVSYEGLSIVLAQFDLDKDVSVAAQEVRDRVNRVLQKLPKDIEQPRVERSDPDATPIMLIALQSNRPMRDVTEYATRTVRRKLESLNGVGGVTVLGGLARQINITVDVEKLQGFGLTVVDVERALRTENVEIPGGLVEQGRQTMQLRVQGRVSDVQSFADLPVATRDGVPIRIRDVAQVEDSQEQAASTANYNGERVVVLAVRKQTGTNTVAVVDALRERVDEIRPSLPSGYSMRIVRDESEFIRNAVSAVQEHLIVGSILAALVVLLFLWNGRSTLIAALAIPTSIIATFAFIKANNLTLNTITLLGLTLAVGIVIDDAIVVLENIVRFMEEKKYPPRQAAIHGTREIGLAVLATTLSLVAVFLPVAFMGGIVGRFMKSFGLTMSFSILVSLFVSFTLTPMLCSRWLRIKRPGDDSDATADDASTETMPEPATDDLSLEWKDPAPEPRAEEKARYQTWKADIAAGRVGHKNLYGKIENAYLRLLAGAMRRRWIVGLTMVGVLLSIGVLGKVVQKNFLPLDDESRFDVVIRAPEGTSLEQTRLISERIARQIRQMPAVSHTVTTVGSPPGDPSGRGPNQASIFVALVHPHQRKLNQQQVMGHIRNRIIPRFGSENLRVLVAPVNVFGGSSADSASIQFVLRGPEIEKLTEYSQALLTRMRKIPGVVDADTTLVVGKPEYVVRVNRDRAQDLGVHVADVANALRTLVGGTQVTTYNEGGEQYEVHVRAQQDFRVSPEAIQQITVPGRERATVRLADVVTIESSSGPSSIQRLGRQRQVTLYANVVPGTSEAGVIAQLERAAADLKMAPGYRSGLAGRSKELGKAAKFFAIAFILSLAFMYLVLAAQFESWIHPVTILLSLPLTVPFALFSLVMLNQSMNIFSTLGILVLFGIVKKNSILQIDHMRDLRRQGFSRADSIMMANRDRLRPILMTTLAFVAGMIPLVASSGAGSGTNRAMGSVIIGGQSLSLLLTLVATPVVYSWFDDLAFTRWSAWSPNRWFRGKTSERPALDAPLSAAREASHK
jgi:HAE1 family hydrophobic/amphiphilic exporter-1